MKAAIKGKKIDLKYNDKVTLTTGEVAEVKGELMDGMLIRTVDSGQTRIIDPFKDILNVIVEQITKGVIQVILNFFSNLFSKSK